MSPRAVRFTYTNYRGEVAERHVLPRSIVFMSTPHHPDEQWILRGYDLDKKAERHFALKDLRDWREG